KLDMDKVLLSKGYCGDNSESTLSFFLCLEKGLTHTFINHHKKLNIAIKMKKSLLNRDFRYKIDIFAIKIFNK
ncbi:hypothetical protein M3204_18035, partial [Mesobacillus subterraneus]|uniref:hypothetical protein n=1 Tax=Mesobacillus subterraneus TaxID=285983 RepID=UPI00203FC80D